MEPQSLAVSPVRSHPPPTEGGGLKQWHCADIHLDKVKTQDADKLAFQAGIVLNMLSPSFMHYSKAIGLVSHIQEVPQGKKSETS